MRNPAARSLELLRNHNFICQTVEYFNPWAKIRKDLFGFIDIVAVSTTGGKGVLGVQSTTGSNMSNRIKKILSIPDTKHWLMAANQIQLHGWRKVKQGGSRLTWKPLIYQMGFDGNGVISVQDVSFLYT